jgi:hypothetical protein
MIMLLEPTALLDVAARVCQLGAANPLLIDGSSGDDSDLLDFSSLGFPAPA